MKPTTDRQHTTPKTERYLTQPHHEATTIKPVNIGGYVLPAYSTVIVECFHGWAMDVFDPMTGLEFWVYNHEVTDVTRVEGKLT